MCQEAFAKTIAVQQIEYLRRAYARATDQIGLAMRRLSKPVARYTEPYLPRMRPSQSQARNVRYRQMVLMDGLTLCLVR